MACSMKRQKMWTESKMRAPKRRLCLDADDEKPPPSKTSKTGTSCGTVEPPKEKPFHDLPIRVISKETLTTEVTHDIKRLQRLKQLPTTNPNPVDPTQQHPQQPLFRLDQVLVICQRLLKEREEELKEAYDRELNKKLAEQYDTFVKFTHDQIRKNYLNRPSYLS